MTIDQFKTYVSFGPVKKAFESCLKDRKIDLIEFFDLLNNYLTISDTFILNGDHSEGHKRNDVISIYHMLAYSYPPRIEKNAHITFYSCGTSLSQGENLGHFDIGIEGLVLRVDPGPGALQSTLDILKKSSGKTGWDPLWIDGILITHSHNDHTGGFQALFERMRWNGLKKNKNKFIIANNTCIYGEKDFDCGPIVDKYKKNQVNVYGLSRRESIKFDHLTISGTTSKHVEAVDKRNVLKDSCLGFRIDTKDLSIGITGDTEWHPDLIDDFKGVDLIIAYIVQESERAGTSTQKNYGLEKASKYHRQFLGEEGVIKLAQTIRPELGIIITDFGDQMKSPDGKYDVIPRTIANRILNRIDGLTPIIPSEEGLSIKIIKTQNKYMLNYENHLFRK